MSYESYEISKEKKVLKRIWESNILLSQNTLFNKNEVYLLAEWPGEKKFITIALQGEALIWENGKEILKRNLSDELKKLYFLKLNEFLNINISFARVIKKSLNDVYLLILVSATNNTDNSQFQSKSPQFIVKIELDNLSIIQYVKCENKLANHISFSNNYNLLIAKNLNNKNVSIYNEVNFRSIGNNLSFYKSNSFIDEFENQIIALSDENQISSWNLSNLTFNLTLLKNVKHDLLIDKYAFNSLKNTIAYSTWNSKKLIIKSNETEFEIKVDFLDIYDKLYFSSNGQYIIIIGTSRIHFFDVFKRKSVLDIDKFDLGEIIVDAKFINESKSLIVLTFNSIIREFDLSECI